MHAASALPLDRTRYPVEDHLGESTLHLEIRMLLQLVRRWLASKNAFVGSDQFIYYRRGDAKARVAPDVYVLPKVKPDRLFGSWKTFETGIAPSVAVEIVSGVWRKDYRGSPARYQAAGVREVILFDPDWAKKDRVRWQVFRRRQGKLQLVQSTNDDRVRSSVLRCWLRATGEGVDLRVRLATGSRGEHLVEAVDEEIARLRAEIARLKRRRG